MEVSHKYISDLKNLIEEQKQVIEEHNKLLLESISEKNKMHEEIVLLRRNSFYLEHELRLKTAELSKIKQ